MQAKRGNRDHLAFASLTIKGILHGSGRGLLLLLRDARFEIANCDLKEHPDFVKLCQKRFYDFNGWSKHKRIENLHIRISPR